MNAATAARYAVGVRRSEQDRWPPTSHVVPASQRPPDAPVTGEQTIEQESLTDNVVECARPDAIFASGRSDYPNQVNNVLAFPSIFRGALDVRATRIDEEMKLAACRAIAAVARGSTSFGRDCIIPMPLDTEGLPRVAAAVAGAAVRTGVASRPLTDLTAYSDSVATRVRLSHEERAHRAPAAPEARHG